MTAQKQNKEKPSEELLTIKEACTLLNCHPNTLRKWDRAGTLIALRFGKRGDRRYKKEDILNLLNRKASLSPSRFEEIAQFLKENANKIQQSATIEHKIHLGENNPRNEFVDRYQKYHIEIVEMLTKNLDKSITDGTGIFQKFGETLAKHSINNGLTIEEAVDGIIFLKQAIWVKLYQEDILKKLTNENFYELNYILGTYIDVLASKIAFTYHAYHDQNRQKSIETLKQFYNLFMQAPLPIAILKGPNHIYELSNPANTQALGNRVKIGKSVKELFPEAKKQGLLDILDRVYSTGEPLYGNEVPFVIDIPGKGTQTTYVNFTYQPLRDTTNKVEGVMVIANEVTEQVVARKTAEENEERFRQLAEATRIIPWEADLETGIFTYVGPQAETLLGYPIKRWYEPTFWPDHIHPDDREWAVQYCINSSKKVIDYEFEYRMIDAKGKSVWLRDIVNVVEGKDKKKMLRGFMLDIADRKEYEEQLKENEEEFRQLAEAIPHIVFSSCDGKVEYINQKWFAYTGMHPESGFNNWESHIHPDDFSTLVSFWKRAEEKGEAFEVQYRLKRYDGVYRWHIARTSPIKNQKGEIVRWYGTATDIDDTKQAEKNLHYLSEASKMLSSSLDYQTTLNAISELAVPTIADWCTIYMLDNAQLKQVTVAHKDPKKIKLAKEINKQYPPDMDAPAGIANVIRTGTSELYPHIPDELLVKIAKDKKHLKLLRAIGFTSVMIVPLCVETKCIGAITFIISEKRRGYTKADLIMAEELATRATVGIENARLYSEAQHAIYLRNDFISVASHELNTPVTSLKMYTQILQKKLERSNEGNGLIPQFQKVNSQVNRLSVLIADLLNVSRIQTGKLEFHEKSFDLNAVMKEAVEAIQQAAQNHTIIIEGNISKTVWGDKDRIEQVITNLLTNAIKYSPEANSVIVRLTPKKEGAVVSVLDFGIGIEKEHQDKIFTRFYRVDSPYEKTFPGLGLGLYIAYEIIKRHGGTMNLESTKGKGSTFSFTLPYNPEEERTSNSIF